MPEWSPDPYIIALTGAGVLIALVAWLPLALRRLPISLPIVCIIIGGLLFSTAYLGFDPSPSTHPYITERLTEFVVIIALMAPVLRSTVSSRSGIGAWRGGCCSSPCR